MSVEEYMNKFLELSRFVPLIAGDEGEKCKKFEEGLRGKIRTVVTAAAFTEFDRLAKDAMRVERSLLENEKKKPQRQKHAYPGKVNGGPNSRMQRREGSFSGQSSNSHQGQRSSFQKGQRQLSSQQSTSSNVWNQRTNIRADGRQHSGDNSRGFHPRCNVCGRSHLGQCQIGTLGCYHCGQLGHIKKDCPSLNQSVSVTQRPTLQNLQGGTNQHQGQQRPQVSTVDSGSHRQKRQPGRLPTQARVFALTHQDAKATPNVVTGIQVATRLRSLCFQIQIHVDIFFHSCKKNLTLTEKDPGLQDMRRLIVREDQSRRQERSQLKLIRRLMSTEYKRLQRSHVKSLKLFFVQGFAHLFAGLVLDVDELKIGYKIINQKSAKDAFNLVAIELGIMYDVLYNKATIVYCRMGFILRCITFCYAIFTLTAFSIMIDLKPYHIVDIVITY